MILTAENYYSPEANQAYMSVSQFKSFDRCEAAAMAEIRGEYTRPMTTALLVGSYVDAWFEGTLDAFKLANIPQIFTKSSIAKKKKFAELHPEYVADHPFCGLELLADFSKAEEIIVRVSRDEVFTAYMSGAKQKIFTATLFGCEWKIKVDSWFTDKIVDLKIMRTLESIMGQSFITHWGYDIQGGIYQAVDGGGKPFYIAAATKEDPIDLEVISVPQYALDEAMAYVGKRMPRFLAVKRGEMPAERCGRCPYCIATKVLTGATQMEDVGYSTKQLREMKGAF